MKKYLLILSFILCGFRGFSQSTPPNMPEFDEKRIHFGVAFGYSSLYSNMVSATSLPLYDTIMGFYSESAPGFTIGVTADLKLLPFLHLRFIPTLVLSERTFVYDVIKNNELVARRNSLEVIIILDLILLEVVNSFMIWVP